MSGNALGDEGAVHIAMALTRNGTIKELMLVPCCQWVCPG